MPAAVTAGKGATSASGVRYDLLMAGAVIASVPVLAMYAFAQRVIVESVSRSGVEG